MNLSQWHKDILGRKAVESLKQNLFDAIYCPTRQEAVAQALQYVQHGTVVAIGTSMTINNDLELPQKIFDKGATILPSEYSWEAMRQHLLSDVYFSSSNAITLNGYLINVDAIGNRVAAMTFGPKKVVIIAGINKVCKDVSEGFERIKSTAAPMNCTRLKKMTPCTKTGYCMDCKSEDRSCRVHTVIKRKPRMTDITVIVVGEDLGL